MSTEPKECECCTNPPPLRLFMAMWMCSACVDKNKQLSAASEAEAEKRVKDVRDTGDKVQQINAILKSAGTIINSIEVKTDIFNAQTVAIMDMAKAIADDDTIANKPGALADELYKLYTTYKEKIFANQQENVELANKQNAIQKYLNELKNKLTEAERERYKLLDVNYKPNQVKLANKPINSPAKPKKYDKAEILKAAQRAGVPASVIQMLCVSKNMTPMQASDSFLNAGSKQIEEKN